MTFFATLLLSFFVILAAIVAMATGVLAGRRQIRGSCGGISDRPCTLCGAGSGERAVKSAGDPQ